MSSPRAARLAIIGATGTARKRVIPALAGSAVCQVCAIQARDERRAAELASAHGIPASYGDIEQMLDNERCDLVYIATPPALHREHVELAAARGLPIICEKPLAISAGEARRIAAVVSEAGRPFMLAHHVRHQPAVESIQEHLTSGALGDVGAAWLQWGFALDRGSANARWKVNPSLGGGNAFYDAGIHAIDLALHLFGPPREVTARGFTTAGETLDNVTCLLGYDTLTVALNASQTMRQPGNDVLLFGSRGRLEAPGAMSETSTRTCRLVTRDSETVTTFEPVNLYAREFEDFVRHYLWGQAAPAGTSLEEALLGMNVLEAIDRSLAEGRSIPPDRRS